MNNNEFDATASMLGYLYQVRFGLYQALRKLSDVDDEDLFHISIERLDDVAFEEKGTPVELLQTKFHGSPGNLSDRSQDIWKTLRIWAEGILESKFELGATDFTLVTTESAAPGSLAELLGCGGSKRDSRSALRLLREIVSTAGSAANQKGYDAFNSLNSWQQEHFVDSIFVIARSPDLIRVGQMIANQLKTTTEQRHLEAFMARLEGEWFKRVIEEMSAEGGGSICLGELRVIIDDLRPQFLSTNLPDDFSSELPEDIDIAGDMRTFVQQLRLFNAPKAVIKQAIINYYRAYGQRTRWSKDGLLNPGELGAYDQKVLDEWEHKKSMLQLEITPGSQAENIAFSKRLYVQCQDQGCVDIRRDFREPFVGRGSYQLLSDDLRLGWHPDYLSLLGATNDEVAS